MTRLFVDTGYKSINHYGEELCGDHVKIINGDDRDVIVLADGLKSGVKASILSTLTSQMISTLMANGLSLEECVNSITETLPVDKMRGVAYSTFTILCFNSDNTLSIMQFDNPEVVMIRDGKTFDYKKEEIIIGERKIIKTKIKLKDGDMFAAFSDGCPYAGLGLTYNFGFGMKEIKDFMEVLYVQGANAKTVATEFINYINKLYGFKPGDDATCVVAKVKKRKQINVLFGLSSDRADTNRMLSLFFGKKGMHIVCGGSTSTVVAEYLGEKLEVGLTFDDPKIPPIAKIEGVDLVTEGIITMNRVNEYAKDFINENVLYTVWGYQKDGASMIARLLFEEATDIDFYVGKAINPAHQNPNLPINFSIKMQIIEQLIENLQKMGKKVRGNFF